MPLGIQQIVRGLHPQTVRGLFHGKGVMHGFKCVDKGKRPKCVSPPLVLHLVAGELASQMASSPTLFCRTAMQ